MQPGDIGRRDRVALQVAVGLAAFILHGDKAKMIQGFKLWLTLN
jgi:hypothetical protein